MRAVLSVLFAVLLLGAGGACAKSAAYQMAAPAPWVLPVSAIHAPAATPLVPLGGVAYVLRDYQVRVEERGKTLYFHSAQQALDGQGVEKVANVSINFDPSYQSLTLHAINVIRDGTVIPKLGRAKINVLQRETELDYLIYDGTMTASALLDDIRIGDIVEYAFSLVGSNPVFQNKFSGSAELEWSVPVEHAFVRLLVPKERRIGITPHNTTLKASVLDAGNHLDYRWERRNIPGQRLDRDTPDWHNPYGSLQWTEFPDWPAVVRWALPLYEPAKNPGAPLQAEIARIRGEYPAAAGRVAAVLKWVQREIRYMGIEVGPGSHAPTAPDTVFQRRFGDCKDKALLTVTMLHALGIDAVPALVNTGAKKGVASLAPTPTAFNHVLVRVRLDGRQYWLDPTRPLQQGDLEHLYQPDYDYALVLDSESKGLALMAQPFKGLKTVRAVFDSSAGTDGPASYTVTTTVRGSGADRLRMQLANNKAEMVTQYQNYYAHNYDGIRPARAFETSDDSAGNALTTVESYYIPGLWKNSKKGNRRQAEIESSDIEAPLKAPYAIGRSSPLQLEYPNDITEITEVLLPHSWNIQPGRTEVKDPAFAFSYEVSRGKDDKSVIITARYLALRDHVLPGDMGNYAAHLKQARAAVGYRLFTGGNSASADVRAVSLVGPEAALPQRVIALARPLLVGVLLLSAWTVLGIRMLRSPAAHHDVNRRLLLSIIVISATLAVFLLPNIDLRETLPVAAVLLAVTVAYLLSTIPQVPATHKAFRLANRCYQARNNTAPLVVRSIVRRALPLIGWFAIATVLARLLTGR